MNDQLDQVSVIKKANVYFDGKCISHSVLLPDGSRKTLGVILPSQLRFSTREAEVMEITSGRCRVRLKDADQWQELTAGQRLAIPADSWFDIEAGETVDYVCHYG
ncbi:MAG: pyrimidine/purine nucleoside phosphorylase [Burkholderiaceae bacterium]